MATLIEFADEDSQPREVGYQSPLPVTTSTMGRSVTKTVTFDGTANKGAQGTVPLFTVSGDVLVKIYGVCTVDLVSAGGGNISVGVTGNTAGLIAATVATAIDAGEIWFDATPIAGTVASSSFAEKLVANGADIFATIDTGDVTAGAIKFYLYFTPLTSDGDVTAA